MHGLGVIPSAPNSPQPDYGHNRASAHMHRRSSAISVQGGMTAVRFQVSQSVPSSFGLDLYEGSLVRPAYRARASWSGYKHSALRPLPSHMAAWDLATQTNQSLAGQAVARQAGVQRGGGGQQRARGHDERRQNGRALPARWACVTGGI